MLLRVNGGHGLVAVARGGEIDVVLVQAGGENFFELGIVLDEQDLEACRAHAEGSVAARTKAISVF